MKENNFRTIDEFYPFYLNQHRNSTNRKLHYIGSIIALLIIYICILFSKWKCILFSLVFGYGFAWFGHFFYEKNKPATFKYPLYSLICDYVMLWRYVSGNLDEDFNKYNIKTY